MLVFIVPHKLFVLIHSNTFVRMDVKNQIAGGKGTEVILIISIMNNNLNSIKTLKGQSHINYALKLMYR